MSDFTRSVKSVSSILSEIEKTDTIAIAKTKHHSLSKLLNESMVTEAKTKHPVPGIDQWNTMGDGHTYDFHLDDGKEDLPASHTVYTIQKPSNRDRGYTVWAWSPPAGHTHRMLGRVSHPQQGVKLAREHYDDNFSTKNESANYDGISEETSAERRYGTNLRIFDNGGKTADRYAIAPPRHAKEYRERDGTFSVIASDENPFHPLGFGQHTSAMIGPHLGKRIHWKDLAPGAKKFAQQEYPEYAPKDAVQESSPLAHYDHKLIFANGHSWLAFRNAKERDKEWNRMTKERKAYADSKGSQPLTIRKAHIANGNLSHPYLVALGEEELDENHKFNYRGLKSGDRVQFESYGSTKKGVVTRKDQHSGLLFVKADDGEHEHFVFPHFVSKIKEDADMKTLTEMDIEQRNAMFKKSEDELKGAIAKHPGLHAIFGDDPDIDTEKAENRPIMHHVQDHHGNISLIHSTDHEGMHRAYMMWRDPDGRGHTSSVVHVTPTLDNTLANVHDEYSRRQKAADGQVRAYVGKNILGALRGLQHESEQPSIRNPK